jgi:SagB-type dehydrogenase family enzyme
MDIKKEISNNRKAIKPSWVELRKIKTDRELELPRPQMFKHSDGEKIVLDKEFPNVKQKTLQEVIASRRSLRQYKDQSMTKEEVSYLLWETSRVDFFKKSAVFRTIPTGGATNSMETYVFLQNIIGIDSGLYHYHQDEHVLVLLDNSEDLKDRVNESLWTQLRGANFTMYITATPYRTEYKYSFTAHKMIAMEAGHAGQNLSLAAEVIDCGACCLAAYRQDLADEVLGIDGVDEFTTYAITVGKK